jgi:thiol-disulfide isomerase/thioredoxin
MKYLVLFLLAFTIISCKNKVGQENKNNSESDEIIDVHDPNMNQMVSDTIHDEGIMLIGKVNRNGFKKKELDSLFKAAYNDHILDSIAVEELKPFLKDIHFKVFTRSCCTDSQREIPALYKVLDNANFNYDHLEMVALSHDKDTPDGLEKGFDVEYVPTIIVFKDDVELGRFVEFPQETLEKDLLAIIKGTGYKHSYEE